MIELYRTPLAGDSALKAYWRFENGYTDESPSGYTLTASGSPSFVADVFGMLGVDLEYDSTQYASIANASCPNLEITGSQTWMIVCKPETNASRRLMSKRGSSGAIRDFYIEADTKPTIYFQGLTTNAFIHSSVALSNGTWYQIIGIYDSANSKIKIFVNGTKTEATASGTMTGSTADFQIGKWGGDTDTFDGVVAEAAVFNRALTDAEVASLYNGDGFAASTNYLTNYRPRKRSGGAVSA